MDLKPSDFNNVRNILHRFSGIWLPEGKEALVRARLMKCLRRLNLGSYEEYFDLIDQDDSEFLNFVDVLTTNKTNFFREAKHFDFLREEVIPKISKRRGNETRQVRREHVGRPVQGPQAGQRRPGQQGRPGEWRQQDQPERTGQQTGRGQPVQERQGEQVKWWSAGCSTGEEPVSCAIQLLSEDESLATRVKILATDLSGDALRTAKAGIYSPGRVSDLPSPILEAWFSRQDNGSYKVSASVRRMITYARQNLINDWPMRGPFQVIMCRNVMIYFDQQTRQELIFRFHSILEPGGYLFLGHSESLGVKNPGFRNLRPAVYQKL